jgi:hypothetical protein
MKREKYIPVPKELDLLAQIDTLKYEIKRLRQILALAALWTAEPGVTIAEIRAALQPKEGE